MVLPHLAGDVQQGHAQFLAKPPEDLASGDGDLLESPDPLQFFEGQLVLGADFLRDDPPLWPVVDQLLEDRVDDGFRWGRWRQDQLCFWWWRWRR